MAEEYDLATLAKALAFDERLNIVSSFEEPALRWHLRQLLAAMEPDSIVEITHSSSELGKDLVMVRQTKFGSDVTAVVVKTGLIGGKTMGKAEEITRQCENCFMFPAHVKTIAEPLDVEKVWVVVPGGFTRQGYQIFESKTKTRAVRVFDGKWLVDQFTQYYPQVFFESGVVDFLKSKIVELESTRLISGCAAGLSESWVDPMVSSLESPVAFDEEALSLVFGKRRLPFSDLKRIVSPSGSRTILTGDPGTGKSTALAKLALDMFKESFNTIVQRKVKETDRVPIPLLVRARDILKFENSDDAVRAYIRSEQDETRFYVKALLVDGLDEVAPDLRTEVVNKSTEFSKHLGCSVIIASRKIESIKSPVVDYKKFELLPFDFGRALNLLGKLVPNVQLLEALCEGLEKVQFQILMTPLSLSLLVEIAEKYKEIPASVTELYDRFTDMALGRFDKDKGIEVLFEYEIKKRFLAQLAYDCCLQKDRLEISSTEFDEFVAAYAKRYSMEEDRLRSFVSEIERSGMLKMGETVAFCHRSFMDYFAAYSIFLRQDTTEDLEGLIATLYFSGTWSDTAFYYIGLKREMSDRTLARLFSVPREEGLTGAVDYLLAVRLLQAGWHSPSETKTEAIKRSLAYAPAIRTAFVAAAKKQLPDFPKIFGDFMVLALCEIGFVSAFLEKEERAVFDELSKQLDSGSVYSSLLLLWSFRRSLSGKELDESINSLLGAMSKIAPILTPEEQARMIVLCNAIEERQKGTNAAAKRKLDRLQKQNPELFKALLPHTKKGFRRAPQRPTKRARSGR